MSGNVFLCVLLFVCAATSSVHASDGKEKKRKRKAEAGYLTIRSGNVAISVDPKVGGRIASMTLDGREILRTTRDPNHHHWGSTVWVAPQSDWKWPPSTVIDSEPYTVVESTEEKIVVRSKVDPSTGLQVTKHVEFNAKAQHRPTAKLTYVVYNRGKQPRRVGVWENTRVNWDGRTRLPAGTKIRLSKPSAAVARIEREQAISILFDEKQPHAQKLFCTPPLSDSNYTWNSFQIEDLVLTKSRRYPGKVAPDHAPLEIYLSPKDGFAELENQGTYEEILPGKSTRMVVMWRLWIKK
ncbi:MAG: DUF4380 domain-containing protein [Planctomycetota bacterium]